MKPWASANGLLKGYWWDSRKGRLQCRKNLGSYCQKLCMGLSCGGAILAFSIHEFDASNDLGELI